MLSIAEVMFILTADPRIKHIDCKKLSTNIIATLASTPENMKILERVDKAKYVFFMLLFIFCKQRYRSSCN